MAKEENLHAGHRERTIDKLLKNPSSFQEHELLEVLLFSFLPRIDTNLIAHRLLKHFGSIKVLLSATAEEVMSVDGIGKTTASKIVLLGQLLNLLNKEDTQSLKKPYRRLYDYDKEVKNCFANIEHERFIIFLLDKKNFPITKLTFEGDNSHTVSARTDDLLHAFAIFKPTSIIVAHNHPSGDVLPSSDDDLATAKIYLLCQLHGIVLFDHVIVSGEKIFSYYYENKLESFKNKYTLENFLRQREE